MSRWSPSHPGDYITLKPQLATEWAYQPDGKTVRFKLRQGVKFPSGKPMTAEDVQFGLQRRDQHQGPARAVRRPYRQGHRGRCRDTWISS